MKNLFILINASILVSSYYHGSWTRYIGLKSFIVRCSKSILTKGSFNSNILLSHTLNITQRLTYEKIARYRCFRYHRQVWFYFRSLIISRMPETLQTFDRAHDTNCAYKFAAFSIIMAH